jgi:hypothetical protein
MSQDRKVLAKKPYSPPKLIKYGDLGDMTRARFKGAGMMDGTPGRKT